MYLDRLPSLPGWLPTPLLVLSGITALLYIPEFWSLGLLLGTQRKTLVV